MCEIINAEIAIGTISCLSDAISYLKWTFFSRRVKMNPSYYGAKSSSEEDLEDFYLEAVKGTMSQLQKEECIVLDESEGTDSFVAPTALGRSCSNFYLLHQTPLQMKKGVNGLKKILSQHVNDHQDAEEMPLQSFASKDMTKRVSCIYSFVANTSIDTFAVAKILYELSFTQGTYNIEHNEALIP